MFLGKVIGRLVPAVVYDGHGGRSPALGAAAGQARRSPRAGPSSAPTAPAWPGPGEMVYWEASREAALTLEPSFVPVDHAVVGIVNDVQIDAIRTGGRAHDPRARHRPDHLDHPSSGHGRPHACWCSTSSTPHGEPTGGYVIAVDTVGAGAGETVLVLDEGNGARQILGGADLPVRSVVVGIVDDLPG